MEVASLVLGAAPVAVQILNGVIKGYQIFEIAADMPEECKSLRLRLRMELTRVLDWADMAGLSNEADHEQFDRKLRANRATVLALLSEMSATLAGMRQLSLRYGDLDWRDSSQVVAEPSAPAPQNALLPAGHVLHVTERTRINLKEDLSDIDFEQYQAFFQSPDLPAQSYHMRGFNHLIKIRRDVGNVVSQPKRVLWALKDIDKFQGQLKRLKELTDFLHESLGDHNMEILKETTRETHMAMLQLTTSFGDMKELLKAATAAKIGGGADKSKGGGAGLHNHNTLFEQLTAFSLASMEIDAASTGQEKLGVTGIPADKLDKDLTWDTAIDTPTSNTPSLATYQGKEVWVEWKTYEPVLFSNKMGKINSGPSARVSANVERLVALLGKKKPLQFRAPLCRGYFLDVDRARFGFIFNLQEPQHSGKPRSLYQHLLEGSLPPPIRARIALAQELAAGLFFLHAVKWLHKGLRSASILIFPDDEDGGGSDYGQPYISGFGYSRPDDRDITSTSAPDDTEWVFYTHPDYRGPNRKPFRKSFDIYSLGIILLEIAYWKPADQFLGPEAGTVMDRLLVHEPQLLNHVLSSMGDRYHNAVRACIEGLSYFKLPLDADESDPVISTLIQQAYLRLVVDVLQGIRI